MIFARVAVTISQKLVDTVLWYLFGYVHISLVIFYFLFFFFGHLVKIITFEPKIPVGGISRPDLHYLSIKVRSLTSNLHLKCTVYHFENRPKQQLDTNRIDIFLDQKFQPDVYWSKTTSHNDNLSEHAFQYNIYVFESFPGVLLTTQCPVFPCHIHHMKSSPPTRL